MSSDQDFSTVNAYRTKALFTALNYDMPTEDGLKNLFDKSLLQNSKDISKTMYVFTSAKMITEEEHNFYAISLMKTVKKTYVFIDSFCEVGDKETLNVKFEDFCLNSVASVYNKFNLKVAYLLHNSPENIGWARTIQFNDIADNINFCAVNCSSKLFYALRYNQSHDFQCPEEYKWFDNYIKIIDDLKYCCSHDKLTDMLHKMFLFCENHDYSKLDLTSTFELLVNPVLYASYFFNFKYKGQNFKYFSKLKPNVEQFIQHALPVESLGIYCDYENEIEPFDLLLQTEKDDPTKMWIAAGSKYLEKSESSKEVCDLITELLELPAFLPYVNLENVWEKLEHLSSIEDSDIRQMRLNLFATDILRQ